MTNLSIEEKRNYRIARMAHSLYSNYFVSGINDLIQENKFLEAKRKLELIKQNALLGYVPNDYYHLMFKEWDYDSVERSQITEDGIRIIKFAYTKAYEYIEELEDKFIEKRANNYDTFANNEEYKKYLEDKKFDDARGVLTRKLGDYYLVEDDKDLSIEDIMLNKRILRKAYMIEMDKIAVEEANVIAPLTEEWMKLIENHKLYKNYKEALEVEEYDEAQECFEDIVYSIQTNRTIKISEHSKKAFEDLVEKIYKDILDA